MDKFIKWSDLVATNQNKVLRLDEKILGIISDIFKFEKVSKVQNTVIPLFLQNKDVCVKACTGSGKTLAFVVPMISRLLQMEAQ